MHLYCAFLGGSLGEGRMGEDHETVFVVAAARRKWRGVGRPHVDALERLDRVDGYAITLVAEAEEA